MTDAYGLRALYSIEYLEVLDSVVAAAFALKPEDLHGRVRSHRYTVARATAWQYLRKKGRLSYTSIGELYGRDRTTILAGVDRWRRLCRTHPPLADTYKRVCDEVESIMAVRAQRVAP